MPNTMWCDMVYGVVEYSSGSYNRIKTKPKKIKRLKIICKY